MTLLGIGGNVRFDRGSGACTDQAEGGDADAVFLVQSGGTLQYVKYTTARLLVSEIFHHLGTLSLEPTRLRAFTASVLATSITSGSRTSARMLLLSSRPLDNPTSLVVELRRPATRSCSTTAVEL